MQYTSRYASPLGEIMLAADERGLSGLWFVGQKYFAQGLDPAHQEGALPVLNRAMNWLDVYFSGAEPDFQVPLHLRGTQFQTQVWEILRAIPYGQTMTYGAIAERLSACREGGRVSAQAVGGAVGHNRISILIPCHRVVGAGGSLTGYAGGLARKEALLRLEGAWQPGFYLPGYSPAP